MGAGVAVCMEIYLKNRFVCPLVAIKIARFIEAQVKMNDET